MPILAELMQTPLADPNFDFSHTTQGALGWGMLTPTHERLLEQYVDKLAANIPFLTLNDKHLALAEHLDKAEDNALLANGIPLDAIG